MELLQDLYMMSVMHTITQALLIPVVVCLLALIIYTIYCIGSILVEYFVERKHFRAYVPELIAKLSTCKIDELSKVINDSKLLRSQKDDLDELVTYLYLPEEARIGVARRLLANEEEIYKKSVGRTNIIAVIGTMLGLMGTLISMGPGMEGLGNSNLDQLSAAVSVAFDTSVAGMAASVVCFVISYIRGNWYEDYIVSAETLMTTILEKADIAHADGYEFKREVLEFEKGGRKSVRKPLSGSISDATLEAKIGASSSCKPATEGSN